ncbi:MAG: zinc-dependent metalloprotease, partial [Bacteroidota bacterium]
CGVTERSPWIDAYQRGEIAIPRSLEEMVLPLRIHIVGNNDGDGYASWSQLIAALNLMNEDFAGSGLSFCIDGPIDYINNSSYYNHNGTGGGLMMALNNDPDVINCYFVGDPNGACGYYSPSRDAMAMANNCLGGDDHTWSHEMGHFLSLPHTFSGWEGELNENGFADLPTDEPAPFSVNGRQVELADSSNCAVAGDGFCDTPADYISERWGCNFAGEYPDSLMDPDSNKFIVFGYPIMGYAFDNCVESFSGEQSTAMVVNAMGRGVTYDGPISEEPANADEIDLLSPENGDLQPIDEFSVQLTWSPATNADFYIVQINRTPIFGLSLHEEFVVYDTTATLSPATNDIEMGIRYYWRIRPVNNCSVVSGVSGVRNFRVTDIASPVIDSELDAALSIFPNPVVGDQSLRVVGNNLPENTPVQLELLSITGQRLVAANSIQLAAGNLNYELPIGNLPSGIYFLRMRQAERLVTRRVVVTR